MTYNVITTRQPQIVIDQAMLTTIQTDLARRIKDLERLQIAIETLAQVNETDRFAAAAMALCNQLAARWKSERASLGFLKGRYVRLQALSHTEKFTRQMRLVQDVEGAMEECLDQDVEVIYPGATDAPYVTRTTELLSSRHGPNTICSLPLRRKGEVVAVLTLERKGNQPFTGDEVETLRLTCDLVTPRLVNLYEHDRWIGARLAASTKRGLALAVGPKHTWIKAAVIGVAAFLAFTVLFKGTYRVQAPFTFESVGKRTIPAPFEGVLEKVRATPGDWILSKESADRVAAAGDAFYPLPNPFAVGMLDPTLATFDTTDLWNQLKSAAAERARYLKLRDIARRDNKEGEAQENQASADKMASDMASLQYKIDQATITSKVDGVVFSGDLKSRQGTRMQAGDVLFEVGQPEDLRAELSVPEDEINRVHPGMKGYLATSSYPGQKVAFTVVQVTPTADIQKDQSVFKVRVEMAPADMKGWMRPGMDGIAKVDAGQDRYAWLWTYRLVNWVRMKLWI